MNRLMKWSLFCGLLSLMLMRSASAASALYQNDKVVSYPGTATYPPVIDATNFVNNGSFTVDFTSLYLLDQFYQTQDTINYTNRGLMVANTGFNFFTESTYTGATNAAGSFFNSGTIRGASTLDLGIYYYLVPGQCFVWATNIVNSGSVIVGAGGLISFVGANVNLSRAKLTLESSLVNTGGANVLGSGVFGLNTNAWYPAFDLGPSNAFSAFFPMAPFYLVLTNSQSYFKVDVGASNNIIRSVFIQNNSLSNVAYNVYFDTANIGFGNGSVTIEWAGYYQDSASGTFITNYLYLNNDYIRSTATNIFLNNGIPDNFTFTASPTPLMLGNFPAPVGYQNVFPFDAVTNRYAFGDAQLIPTSVSTNDVADQSLTNLPGRIQISASQELNVSLAEISGANFVSLQAPHQFDGSSGAFISAPYLDLNLGVTNGRLAVTNLLESQIPNWSGEVQAWSTRWLAVDATGVTNDYRVVIVGSQLTPTTLAQVQDLMLHGSNSIVISDALNVIRNFNADTRNLTLTTNGVANGAASLDGELNFSALDFYWQNAVPNLQNLTNNGAIRIATQANFGGPPSNNVVATIPALAAQAILSRAGTNVVNVSVGEKVQVGNSRYTFVSSVTNTIANQIKIAATFDGSLSNLIAAINGAAGAGTVYSSITPSNAFVGAGLLANHAFTVSARLTGSLGNTNQITVVSTNNILWTTNHVSMTNGELKTNAVALNPGVVGTLAGGSDAIIGSTNVVSFPYDNLINNGFISDLGSIIYAANFVSSGVISNGSGGFTLQSLTATLTNGSITAAGDISITASSNLVTSNLLLEADRSLTLWATNWLTDGGITNGSVWSVGAASVGEGITILIKPATGDLLGTTITNVAPTNTSVINTWAGVDRGLSPAGYTNNLAVGRLILDAQPSSIANHNGAFVFNGAGASNALYVDYLELRDYATNGNNSSSYDFPWLTINTNLVIYFAQAVINGYSVADKIDFASREQGANGGRLRWIPTYNGHFSSTNLVFPAGVTNAINVALLTSSLIDSDGDGLANAYDSTPFFLQSQVNLTATVTNLSPASVRVQWRTPANATNSIEYRTNLAVGDWLPFTNFNRYYYGNNFSVTNLGHGNQFISPQVYQPYPGSSPATNVWIFDTVTNTPHYYRVLVQPWLTYPN
jgi:hypothetical protein